MLVKIKRSLSLPARLVVYILIRVNAKLIGSLREVLDNLFRVFNDLN